MSQITQRSADVAYSNLLKPLDLGPVRLRNRLIMGSMHMRLGFAGDDAKRLAAFYTERAKGGAALIVTGGVAPNRAGRMEEDAAVLDNEDALEGHRRITAAVHEAGAACVMQILHAGRYAKHAMAVGPSDMPSPINPQLPRCLTAQDIEATIEDYVRCAVLARMAGYDGVDVMGSEGYLINEFTARRTNNRTDDWGGTPENRFRFPLEIVGRIRARLGPRFLILYRISAIDLVENGATADETATLARMLEDAGADALATGIGWHESRVPTIAHMVPRGAWRFAAARLKRAVTIPIIASNRINTPELAEEILAAGEADLVALARPLLADPQFLLKARSGRRSTITPCIACNQSCLDHIFTDRTATCLVNPRAGHELDYSPTSAPAPKRFAVAGAGPAGLSFAITAARRGHHVVIFEACGRIGGQLDLARRVPGKEEFGALLEYYEAELDALGVEVRLSTPFDATRVREERFDRVVIATGVRSRTPEIAGIHHAKIAHYPEVLRGEVQVGKRVAIIGAGAIAYDVAEFLTAAPADAPQPTAFHQRWGVDTTTGQAAGGLLHASPEQPSRKVHLLQRTPGRPAARLGISTGWILRTTLKQRDASIATGCTYTAIDDEGLHYAVDGTPHTVNVDNVVVCAGQVSRRRELIEECAHANTPFDVIGGARDAAGLDAQRAIAEGYRLGLEC